MMKKPYYHLSGPGKKRAEREAVVSRIAFFFTAGLFIISVLLFLVLFIMATWAQ